MKTVRPLIAAVLALALCTAGAVRAADDSSDLLMPGPAPKADVSPKAQEAIQQMLKAYGDLKTYQATFTLATEVVANGKPQNGTTTGTVRIERPNKVSVRLKDGDLSIGITCDGKQCMEYFSGSNKYLQWKAPSNLDSVLGNPSFMQVLRDMSRVTLIPFSSQPYKSFMIGVSKAQVLGGGGGKPTHVQLDVASGVLDLYIDPKSHLVTEAHALPTRMIQAVKAQNPAMSDLKITYDLTQKVEPADQPMPADAFSVTPPKGATEATSPTELFEKPALKEMADFKLESLTKGKTVQLSDYKGKVILLDFWATWCPPCRAELPILAAVNKEFADKGLVFFAVNQQEDRQKVEDFLKEQKLDFPVLLDTKGKAGEAYGVESLPTLYLIGKDGKVIERKVGVNPSGLDKAKADLEKAVKDALAAPAPKS